MATWAEFETAEPELAAWVRRSFDAGRHKTIATLRADGSPRISGIECEFVDGELRFGSMSRSRKGADLHRDQRFALHGPTVHPAHGEESSWPGEAKVAGRAIPGGRIGAADPDGAPGDQRSGDDSAAEVPAGEFFVADLEEVVVTHLDDTATRLVVEWWTPSGGRRRIERD
jgi:hypothetical protein